MHSCLKSNLSLLVDHKWATLRENVQVCTNSFFFLFQTIIKTEIEWLLSFYSFGIMIKWLQGFWYFAEKKAKFCGILRGKFAEKWADFAGFSREKSQNSRNNRPISGDFRGRKVKIRRKIGPFRGILAEKSQFSKDFQGQILRKIGRFHGKFRGETSPRNNQ